MGRKYMGVPVPAGYEKAGDLPSFQTGVRITLEHVAKGLKAAKLKRPDGEAEEHVNQVLDMLAYEIMMGKI